jgi:hypothetical protein
MPVNNAEILKKMQAQLKSASAITKQVNQECQTADKDVVQAENLAKQAAQGTK